MAVDADALECDMTFRQVNPADGAMRIPGTRRIDAFIVATDCVWAESLMSVRRIIIEAAGEFYDSSFQVENAVQEKKWKTRGKIRNTRYVFAGTLNAQRSKSSSKSKTYTILKHFAKRAA